jgi:iron uptake system EfeUOB component EfeO/EfeM
MFEKASKGGDLPKSVMTIYAPVRLAYENCRPVKWFFDWYLHDLWNL